MYRHIRCIHPILLFFHISPVVFRTSSLLSIQPSTRIMDSPVSPGLVDPSLPKRIVICCDGTWYAVDKGVDNLPSNVARLSRALKKVGEVSYGEDKGQKRAQIVYYQSGVGTGNLTWLDKSWQGMFTASP